MHIHQLNNSAADRWMRCTCTSVVFIIVIIIIIIIVFDADERKTVSYFTATDPSPFAKRKLKLDQPSTSLCIIEIDPLNLYHHKLWNSTFRQPAWQLIDPISDQSHIHFNER